MSLTFSKPGTYTQGRGIVRVKKTADTTWQDFVHCKEFKVTVETEELEHENVRAGVKFVDKTITTKLKAKGSMVVDVPDLENIKKFFLSSTTTAVTQASGTWTAEAFTVTKPDEWQSLGKRRLTITSITDDAGTPVPLVEGVDYYIDLVRGLFLPLSTSTLIGNALDGFKITGTYAAETYNRIKAGEEKQLVREIWFAGDPATGVRQDIKGYCNIKPSGDLGLIADEWESFTFDIMFNSHATYGDLGVMYEDLGEV